MWCDKSNKYFYTTNLKAAPADLSSPNIYIYYKYGGFNLLLLILCLYLFWKKEKRSEKNKIEEMWVLEFEKDETENWIWNKRGQLSFGQTL